MIQDFAWHFEIIFASCPA